MDQRTERYQKVREATSGLIGRALPTELLGFASEFSDVSLLLQIYSSLNSTSLEFFSLNELDVAGATATRLSSLVDRIDYAVNAPGGSRFPTEREVLLRDLVDIRKVTMEKIWPKLTCEILFDPETKSLVDQLRRQLQETEAYVSEARNTIDKALDAAREAAGLTALATGASHFGTQAEADREGGRGWLVGAAVSLLLMVAAGFLLQWRFPVAESQWSVSAVQQIGSRVVLIGALLYATVFCARIAIAARHNAVINSHRQNAMETFQSFVHAGASSEIRSAILIEAARAILMPQPTGYRKSDSEPPQTGQVVEIIRGLGPNKTGS